MKKFITSLILLSLLFPSFSTGNTPRTKEREKLKQTAEKLKKSIPDSLFSKIRPGNLLDESLYLRLAKEGWTTKEIFTITDDYLEKNKKQVKGTFPYVAYAKEWKPYWYMLAPNDSIKHQVDPVYSTKIQKAVSKAFEATADDYNPRLFYTPDDRMNGIRNKGYFRHNVINPSVGRIHFIQPNPKDSNQLMCIPDGDAIWRTDNGGKNWEPVTDRIPNRFHRTQSSQFCIPVDPDDWNHFFAFMDGTTNPVYETTDGGKSWTLVPSATHKTSTEFKKGYAFKDAAGTLKIIGVERSLYTTWDAKMWLTENKGVTWRQVTIPGSKNWLQEIEFDPVDRNLIYITTGLNIWRSTDGLAYVNNKYTLQKMSFKVYDRTKTTLLNASDTTAFPFPTNDGPMILKIDPRNTSKMWAAMGCKSTLNSALYYSEDKGKTWITLTNTAIGVGTGQVFGNEAPGGWLGDFAVNFRNPNLLYGCTMSSAKSTDGGKNFSEYAWGYRMKGLHPDGKFYEVTASRHNADNHAMACTPSGRIFRGSDGGMLMVDPKINGGDWCNIGGDMGQHLFYKVRVNEFGDFTLIGNSQDNDAQTYRYGRWGNWRGYEGTTAAINPMSNETYFSGGGGGSLEGTDWGNSWNEGYTKADPVTGNWYVWRAGKNIGTSGTIDLGVVKDIGRSVQPITINTASSSTTTRDFALCRDTTVGSSLLVLRSDGAIVRFDNESTTYTTVAKPTFSGYTGACITVNPENVKEIYVADNTNGVLKTTNGGASWTKISSGTSGIPTGITFNNIYYHEGSGDIYAISNAYGIFLKQANSSSWSLWMKGYNPAAFGGAQISYTTQEMMVFDYGRGVWLADLENPADRFFKQGFKIKQLSNINGVRTFGIDTKWDIPLYYNYQWYINGVAQTGTQYRTFSSSTLNANDKVKLKLTLRESPDVQTTSSEVVIGSDATQAPNFAAGRAIKSVGTGRMDLGHRDYFENDFSVEMWVKPVSTDNSVLIGNRKLDSREQQGWLLGLIGGSLKFVYSPQSQFYQPPYETSFTQEASLVAGALTANTWSHIAVTVQRSGLIKMYVNGVLKTSATRILPKYGLNSVQPLSLLADGYEYNPSNATIDELRIWKKPLSLEEIRGRMSAQPVTADSDLVYYNDFNAATTALQQETFSKTGMRSRIRAEVTYPEMSMAVCANVAKYDTISSTAEVFSKNSEKIVSARILTAKTSPVSIYRFDNVYTASTIRGMTTEHYDVAPYAYKIDLFGTLATTDSLEIKFFVPNAANYNGESIFMASADKDVAIWAEKTKAKYDAADGTIVARFKAADLNGQLIAIIKAKPAIALTIPSASASGVVPVYRETQNTVPFTASLLRSMPAPTGDYTLTTSRAFASANPLNFGSNTSASSTLTFNPDSLGSTYNQSTPIVINGMDNRMIPYQMTLQNRIAPKGQGTSVKFNGGGATIGSASDYAALNNSNTITMMGWVRLDDSTMVTTTSTTVKPLIFFRGGGATTGLHLDKGELRCHWNEESWSWGLATGLKLTKTDLGKWVNIALVASPTSITFYMNGRKFTQSRTMTKTRILSPLMLGRNNDGDTWFKGAFDQVLLWNRSLTEAEIMKYMHERAYNNETGLVASVNMDARNESGTLVEMCSNSAVTVGGTVEQNHRSAFPFESAKQTAHSGTTVTSTTDKVAIQMPASLVGSYYLTQYEHLPYNFAISGLSPAYKGFFTATYTDAQTFGVATDSITFICRQPSILKGDAMQLVVREFGRETVFISKATTVASADGLAVCKVKASLLPTSFEAMWMTNSSNLQTIALSVENATDLNKIILKDSEVAIPVVIERTSTRTGGKIDLVVKESNYARFANPEVDLSQSSRVVLPLIIDRSKINPLAYNSVQISFIGATGNLLNMKFAPEPAVQLALANGTDATKITATGSTVTLNVEAKLVQGVLEDAIKLDVSGDMDNGVSVGTGYLTVTGDANRKNLDYFTSPNKINAGWNLVSNPYLATILMSKQENRTLDNISSFCYQFNPASKNFMAIDTRYFDNNMWLKPMEPFFIQASNNQAELTINGAARNRTYNRKNTSYFVLSQVQEIGLELWSDNILFDRTAVRLDNNANQSYVFDEDAPKMLSFDAATPQIYTLSSTDKLSVNAVPASVTEIPLGLKTTRTGTYTFKLAKATHDQNATVELIDMSNNTVKTLREIGDVYSFALATSVGTVENRFKLRISIVSGIDSEKESSINIWAERNICHIDGLTAGTRISIFDTLGKKVVDQTATGSSWSTQLPSGVYMVNLNIDSKEYKGKIIIK